LGKLQPTPGIRLLALDVDGTLLNSRHEITPEVCRAIRDVAEAGVQIVLTSARGPAGLQPILRELGIRGYSVAFSGALRCRTAPGEPVEPLGGERLDLADARAVVLLGRELGVSTGWWDTEAWYVDAKDGPVTYEAKVIEVEPMVADLAALEIAPFKLQCMVPMEGVDRLELMQDRCPLGLSASFSNPNYLEVVRLGVDKARGLARLGEAIGIALPEMAAIGDGENDLGMLKEVGIGIAMANAKPSVRAASTWVTTSNDEDGVAVAIGRLRMQGSFQGVETNGRRPR
jgi:Cof subfamily protein (haloacid dehalogenase superfamily)